MIHPKDFYNALQDNGVGFFTGVPDSLLSPFSAYVSKEVAGTNHIIAANEGGAVALATGYHLATGKIGLVYMQNSGLGNAVNPILSLASSEVYAIPMLLLVGWRGEPGKADEPQHIMQGRVQNDLLDVLEVPYVVLDDKVVDVDGFIRERVELATRESRPVAIVVRKGVFEPFKLAKTEKQWSLSREEAIQEVLNACDPEDVFVSTTGKASRELYENRLLRGEATASDFLTVGSMGHASQIALGVALNTSKRVICIDGDGAVLMHMGALPIVATNKATNLIHIVLNNGAHESVGGQATVGFQIELLTIAKASGYARCFQISQSEEIQRTFLECKRLSGPIFIEIKVNTGARNDLIRPKESPVVNKQKFQSFLKEQTSKDQEINKKKA